MIKNQFILSYLFVQIIRLAQNAHYFISVLFDRINYLIKSIIQHDSGETYSSIYRYDTFCKYSSDLCSIRNYVIHPSSE